MNIHSAHSLMSIPSYYKLLEKKIEWENATGKKIRTYGETVMSHHVQPDTLGGEFCKPAIKKILQTHPKDTWDDQQSIKNLNGILKSIVDSKPNIEKINHFVAVYDELDRRRRTNWKMVFPNIAAEIEKYKHELV